jgi:hypothetical protein
MLPRLLLTLPILVLSAGLLFGCTAQAEPVQPTETAEAEVTANPAAVEPFFVPSINSPLVLASEQVPWAVDAIEPGAIYVDGRDIHLFFNTIEGWPAKIKVGYARSTDGEPWQVSDTPVLDSALADFPGFTFFTSSLLRLGDGKWGLYLYTLDEGRDGATGGIMVAVADDLAGPWRLIPDYALPPGPAGSWSAARVSEPSVVFNDGHYWMYYSGADTDRLYAIRQIGLAVSADGLIWEKWDGQDRPLVSAALAGQPLMVPGESAEWDSGRIFLPRVVQTASGWVMMYKSNIKVGRGEAFGLATSIDGIQWHREPTNPLFDEKTYGQEWQRVGIANLILINQELILLAEVLEREGGGYHHGNSPYFSNLFVMVQTGPLEAIIP